MEHPTHTALPLAAAHRAAAAEPGDVNAWSRLAAARHQRGELLASMDALRRAYTLRPGAKGAVTLGKLALAAGRLGEAVAWLERAVRHDPAGIPAHLTLATALLQTGNPERGLELCSALLRSDRLDGTEQTQCTALYTRCAAEARAKHEAALAEAPGDTDRIARYVQFLNSVGDTGGAIALLRWGMREHPQDGRVLSWLLRLARDANDWNGHDALVARTIAAAEQDIATGRPPALNLNVAFSLPVPAAFLRRLAEAVGRPLARPTAAPVAPARDGPIHVGYLSGAFRDDATSHLMQRMFGLHNRSRVAVTAFSFGRDDGSSYRRRIAQDADAFIDLRFLSDDEAASAIRAQGIDILIDVDGYFGAPRPGIAARRPAPVQIRFLDFPGTTGAPFFDYYVSDRYVTPPGSEADFSEALIRLPHSYQVNDFKQEFTAQPTTRADHGLPEDATVFCCFCSPFKIEPTIFGTWMRILERVPGAVLWLMRYSPLGEANLKREAANRGVAPERLVFAPFLGKAAHLTRHRLADLALDTLFWNGHTTSSDALWAGVPVLTLPGDTFAARVSGSLLHAIGLPELIAETLDLYESMAVDLGRDGERLAALKTRLERNRTTHPLFDTPRYVRNFERALETVWSRHRQGLPPQPLDITG